MATNIARPRQPSSGYKNKYYDPVKAHKYYLGKRKLKGYKDRYKNSDRRRNREGADDENESTHTQKRRVQESEKARLEEEREQRELEEEATSQEEERESSRQMYAHTGDARTGIHAARGWTVMQAQEQGQAARGALGHANAQVRTNKEERKLSFVPEGYDVSDEVRVLIERYDDLVGRIRPALRNLDPPVRSAVTLQLKELDDRMKNLVAGAATLSAGMATSSKSDLRKRIERYSRALGREAYV